MTQPSESNLSAKVTHTETTEVEQKPVEGNPDGETDSDD